MDSTDSRFSLYNGLLMAYSRVVMPSDVLSKSDACTPTFLEGFFRCLQFDPFQTKQEEEGVDKAMIDLHAFVSGLDYFARIEDEDYSANVPPPEHISVMINRSLTQVQPGIHGASLKENKAGEI